MPTHGSNPHASRADTRRAYSLLLILRRCPYRLYHAAITVMQTAQDRDRDDATDGLNPAADRCVLAQREMRANSIIIGGVSGQESAQMCLAEYDDVVEAFASDRTDHSLDIAFCHGERGAMG